MSVTTPVPLCPSWSVAQCRFTLQWRVTGSICSWRSVRANLFLPRLVCEWPAIQLELPAGVKCYACAKRWSCCGRLYTSILLEDFNKELKSLFENWQPLTPKDNMSASHWGFSHSHLAASYYLQDNCNYINEWCTELFRNNILILILHGGKKNVIKRERKLC